jgi:hypothetical protein
VEDWTLQIFLDPCLVTPDLSFGEERVAMARACGSAWRCVGEPMVMDLPHICRFVPCKHESSINFVCDERVKEFF